MCPVPNQFGESTEWDYLLGFIACDGSFAKNETTISLELQQRDLKVMELFCKHFNTNFQKPRVLKGKTYLRAHAHGIVRWSFYTHLLGGRLKPERVWPESATAAFVAGCLDADGCFYLHHGRVEGEFQHASKNFRTGFEYWLIANGIDCWQRTDRPILYFPPTACRKLAKLWPDCGLTRKRDIAATPAHRDHREWLDWQLKLALDRALPNRQVAELTGKTKQAVNLKRWRLFNATSA